MSAIQYLDSDGKNHVPVDFSHPLPVTGADGGGLAVQGRGAVFSDASVASAVGTSQTLVAEDVGRVVLSIVNVAATSWWISPTGAAAEANGAGCFELRPGEAWTPRVAPTNAVAGVGAASSKLSVWEG